MLGKARGIFGCSLHATFHCSLFPLLPTLTALFSEGHRYFSENVYLVCFQKLVKTTVCHLEENLLTQFMQKCMKNARSLQTPQHGRVSQNP